MATDTTQQLGWAKEGTAGTDPISLVTSDYWKFGMNTNRFDYDHPIETHNWIPTYKGDTTYPNELSLISTDASQLISFYPTNLIPWYMILATAATHSEAGDVHTITPRAPGTALETYTIRSEMTGGTDTSFISMTGCKARALNFSFNRAKLYESLVATMQFVGFETKTSTLNETHTTKTKYPTDDGAMTGTEVINRFKWNTDAVLLWDSEGDDVDYDNDLMNFNSQIVHNLNVEGVENQTDAEYIDEGNYEFRFGFQLLRGSDHSIYDDFLASVDPPDEHFVFKIEDVAGTNYFQIEYEDVGLYQCRANYAKFQGDDRTHPVWDVMGIAEDISITGKDGLHANAAQNKFYGESL